MSVRDDRASDKGGVPKGPQEDGYLYWASAQLCTDGATTIGIQGPLVSSH